MSNSTFSLKLLTQAHNKVGIVLSGLLLVIFITGSVSVFRPELNNLQWGLSSSVNDSPIDAAQIIAMAQGVKIEGIKTGDIKGAQVKVLYPTERARYYRLVIKHNDAEQHLVFAQHDARLLATSESQSFADFVFAIHTHLLLPTGKFVVGFAGLYLLFLLQSGVVIHWRQIKRQLFKFRTEKNKDKWLDLHKLFGLTALPFSYMVSLTGVIFNLVLIFQIAFVLVLYQGDAKPLLADAGFYQHQPDRQYQQSEDYSPQKLAAITANHSLKSLSINDFGFDTAYVQLDSKTLAFEPSVYHIYQLNDANLIFTNQGQGVNASSFGVEVMKLMHIGDYGGLVTQGLYFALGLCCSVLIYSGMRLWLGRQYQDSCVKPWVLKTQVGAIYAVSFGLSVGLLLGAVMVVSGLHKPIENMTLYWPAGVLLLGIAVAVIWAVVSVAIGQAAKKVSPSLA